MAERGRSEPTREPAEGLARQRACFSGPRVEAEDGKGFLVADQFPLPTLSSVTASRTFGPPMRRQRRQGTWRERRPVVV